MPPKKLFLDIASPRRTSPIIAFPDASIQQDSHTVIHQLTATNAIYLVVKCSKDSHMCC